MFGSRNFLFAKSAGGGVVGGKLFLWGRNNFGQLGTGNTYYYSSPVQVGALTTWSQIATTTVHTLAVKTTGELWAWGRNNDGQLGTGNKTTFSSPVQIGALTNWKTPSVSGTTGNFSLCLKTDGTLWAWGRNNSGQLGLGNTYYYSSPKQIGALTNWAIAKNSAPSSVFSLATDTAGKLFAWGDNSQGQLGQNDRTDRSSPTQVGSLTNWATPAAGFVFSVCVKTDGTLWSWGSNSGGRLGLGNTTYYSSPKQIGSLTNWATPAAGNNFAMCVKTDGTLWSWGVSNNGQLGLNDLYPNRSSPTQVGALTNWSKPICGDLFAGCVKTDGTLWVWGRNNFGQLGLGNTTQYSSPVQVGSLTTWLNPSAGVTNTGCIQS
jgi:alpha-tubulin suppressor-like RCC1 family protein